MCSSGGLAVATRASGELSRRSFVEGLLASLGLATASLSGCVPQSKAGSGSGSGSDSGSIAVSATSSVPTIYDAPAAAHSATLMMVGDVLVHTKVWQSGLQDDGSYNFDHLYAQMADDFEQADISIVNQETILGGTELGLSGYPLFNSPQEIGDAEAAVGVDVAAAATNHALDQGYSGILAELEFWDTEHPEVACIGIADSQERADTITILERDDIQIAILDYTQTTNGISIPSSAPWCVRMLDEDTVSADVAAARELGADFVVVLPHWGTEYVTSPTSAEEEWAALFLELGVDVVIGTHPHVIQPVEVLERDDGHRMLVFWSLGNYTSTQNDMECMVGGMAQVTFELQGGEGQVGAYSMVPTITHRASGTGFGTYRLDAYTEDLASENLIRNQSGCSGFTRAWCVEFCADVLGEGFDTEACMLSGTV